MRRNFAQILELSLINISKEYNRLIDILYCGRDTGLDGTYSLYDMIDCHFSDFSFRGTCLSLKEFDEQYGFDFPKEIQADDIDTLVTFCEYFYNLLVEYNRIVNTRSYGNDRDVELYCNQIHRVMEGIGYMKSEMNKLVIFVERSPEAVAVAESPLIPKSLSYKLIFYNHHSMKGNLQEKKNTILQLADLLEPKKKNLEEIDKNFSSDLFYLFNNINLRHNNIDPAAGWKYKKAVAEMKNENLEYWYDETYQMCLLAFLRLEHVQRKIELNNLKSKIETK